MPPRLGAGGSGGGGVRVPIDADVTGLQRGLAQAEAAVGRFGGRMDAFGQRMDATGRKLTRSLTLPIVGAGVAAGKLAIDFESSMKKITTLVGISRKQVDQWGKDILALAPKVAKSPRELADAMFFITSAGLRGAEALEVLEASAKASAAGLGETKVVADLATSAMNAYGKEVLGATQATDILVAGVREGKIEATEFAGAVGTVLPVASELGITFDQAVASLAAMSRTGTDANTAATQLNAIMSALLKPSKQAADQMAEYGFSAAEMRKQLAQGPDGLVRVLLRMKDATGGNVEELARMFPNVRGLRGLLDLLGKNAKDNEKIFRALAGAGGETGRAFAGVQETADFKLRQALARLQVQGVKLGNKLIPVASDIASGFVRVLDAFDRLPGAAKKAAGAGAIILAGLGPAMRMVGLMSRGIAGIGRGLGGLAGRGAVGTVGGGIAGGVGRGAPIPVFVTNPGFGGGGPGGVVGRGPGAAGRAGRVVVPGIGTLAAGGVGAPLLAGGALIGAGVVASRSEVLERAGLGMTREQSRQFVRQQRELVVQAWRAEGPRAAAEIARVTADPMGRLFGEKWGKETIEGAENAIAAFKRVFRQRTRETSNATKSLITASVSELKVLPPEARAIAADGIVQFAREMQRKGDLPKGAVKRLIAALEKQFGSLPVTTKRAADLAAAKLGVFTGAIRDALGEALELDRTMGGIARHDYRLVGGPAPGARVSPVGRAMGGFVPGRFDGRDDIPIRVSRGEVILNPTQQRIVGIDRIVGALRSTGGIIGGDGASFARGGYVTEARKRAQANVGDPYGKPSRGQSRTGPDTWDCCLVGETLVFGPGGPKRMDALQIGDRVWSFVAGRLEAHTVTSAWFTKRQPVYRVRTRNRAVLASDNHPFLVVRRRARRVGFAGPSPWDLEWVRTDELRRGDLLVQLTSAPPDGEPFDADLARLVAGWGGQFTLATVLDVEGAGEADTYDITVDGSHNFVADGLVVHNSGYATFVAGVNVGGTTATAYRASRAVRDHTRYPIVWGFRKSHSGGYRGGYDEHMGVRVGGVWYQTSGGRVAQTGSDGDWQEIRVPHGLEGLTDADGGPIGESATGRPSLARLQRTHRGAVSVARRLLGRGAVGDRSVSDVLSETLTGAQRGSSLREKRRRAFAEGAARSAGITNPDKIRALGDVEVLRLRRQEVGRDARLVRAAAAKVRKQIARWRSHARKLYKALAKTDPRNRDRTQRLLDGIRNAKDRERESVQELRALIAQAADLQAEAAELDWDIGQLVDEVAQLEDTEPTEVGETDPSADQQAQLDQATRRAEIAERQAQAGEAFIRAIGSSSDIDPASGAVTIIVNAPGGLVHEQEVGRWVVEALRGQGAPGASVSRSAA